MKKNLLLFILFIITISVQAQTAVSYLKSAIDKQNSGDNEGAIADCNKALETESNNAIIFNVRALSKYNLKQYADAIEDYSRTIKAYPTDAIAYNYRGSAQYYIGHYEEAVKDFTAALRYSPKYVSALNNRGNAKVKMLMFTEAIADFTQAINASPDNAAAYNNRAYVKNLLEKYSEALADCDKALYLDPKIAAGVFRNRAFARIGLGLYEQGIADCNKAISLEIDNARVYHYRGYAYYKLQKYDLAVKDDKSVTEYEKDNDDTPPFWDYRDDAEKLARTMPASVIANNPTKANTPAQTTAAVIVPKAIAPVEAAAATIVNLNWIKPMADFDNLPDGILKLPDNNEVNIKIKALSNNPLDKTKFHLYVNGQDFSNGNKMTIADVEELKKKNNANTYTYTYEAKVNVAKNKSTIYLKYEKTTSDTLTVMYTPTDISLHVLAIGTRAPLLKFPEQDAKDFAAIFTGQQGEGRLFKNVSAEVLAGDDAQASAIGNKIMNWSQKTYSNRDVLMLFISSHGFTDNGKLLLTGSNYTSTSNKKYTTIDFKDEVLEPLSNINCKKFVFIDACHSGASVAGSKAIEADVANEINKMASSDNSITIITSSSSNEQSWEDESWGNGAFTMAIKEGLKQNKADKDANGFVSIDELYEYIRVRVPELVKNAGKKDNTGNPVTQTPKMSNSRGNVSIFQKL